MGGVLKLSVHTSKFSLSWRRLEVGWKLVQGLKSLAGHIVIGKVAPPLTTQVLSSDTARVCTVKSDECTLLLPLALASLFISLHFHVIAVSSLVSRSQSSVRPFSHKVRHSHAPFRASSAPPLACALPLPSGASSCAGGTPAYAHARCMRVATQRHALASAHITRDFARASTGGCLGRFHRSANKGALGTLVALGTGPCIGSPTRAFSCIVFHYVAR